MSKGFLITLVLVGITFVAALYLQQGKMIYFPRPYTTYTEILPLVEKVNYQTPEGQQSAFLFPPQTSETPDVVWWMFGGNGATALDWIHLVARAPVPKGHTFILVDYPGYGFCEGTPSPDTIYQSVDELYNKLASRWNITGDQLAKRSRCMGHSLGSAVALHTAATYRFPRVVAVSPFTTMEKMAKRRVGILSFILKHRYDNQASLLSLTTQTPPAKVQIIHGTRDTLIPFSMGKELSQLGGDRCSFLPVEGSGHNDILSKIQTPLQKILAEP